MCAQAHNHSQADCERSAAHFAQLVTIVLSLPLSRSEHPDTDWRWVRPRYKRRRVGVAYLLARAGWCSLTHLCWRSTRSQYLGILVSRSLPSTLILHLA